MFELSLLCPQHLVEAVSDALELLQAQSVSVEDADASSEAEQPAYGEPGMAPTRIGWRHSSVKALFANQALAQDAARALAAQEFFADCELGGITAVPDQDWVRLTQAQFAPVPISPGFWIVPTWHDPPAGAQHILRLDPGLAFGTGTHPSTSMCLRWIALRGGAGALGRVLDYGCGSGILAIAATMFGASAVDAVDIDHAALDAAAGNAAANAAQIRCGTPEMASGQYETVLANILATPLKILAPLLCARLAPGGHLVLAGILERQAGELIEAYASYVPLAVATSMEGWILMTGTK